MRWFTGKLWPLLRQREGHFQMREILSGERITYAMICRFFAEHSRELFKKNSIVFPQSKNVLFMATFIEQLETMQALPLMLQNGMILIGVEIIGKTMF